jgi:MarR family transcriptional regulator, organic hydroperoxide resistance regulator
MPSEAPSLDTQLCFALYSTMHAVGRTYAPLLGELGLTYPQYLAMLVLWESDDMTVKAIGDRLFLDSGTLTPLLKRLEAAKLIARSRDPQDERQVRIRLTEDGHAMKVAAGGLPAAMACAMGRDANELSTLRDDLIRVRASLIEKSNPGVTAGH